MRLADVTRCRHCGDQIEYLSQDAVWYHTDRGYYCTKASNGPSATPPESYSTSYVPGPSPSERVGHIALQLPGQKLTEKQTRGIPRVHAVTPQLRPVEREFQEFEPDYEWHRDAPGVCEWMRGFPKRPPKPSDIRSRLDPLGIWKRRVTEPVPAFHVRNIMSNAIMDDIVTKEQALTPKERALMVNQFNDALDMVCSGALEPSHLIVSPGTLQFISDFNGNRRSAPCIYPGEFTVGLGPVS